MAQLHPQLQNDCIKLGRFELCRLLLKNDSRHPWFILAADRESISEIFELTEADQQLLMQESLLLSRTIHRAFKADKLNIAALGNVVPQLHIHHIVRYRDDPSWPAPVWGKLPALPYSGSAQQAMTNSLRKLLGSNLVY